MRERLLPLAELKEQCRHPQAGLVVLGIELDDAAKRAQGLAGRIALFEQLSFEQERGGVVGCDGEPVVDMSAGVDPQEAVQEPGDEGLAGRAGVGAASADADHEKRRGAFDVAAGGP